MNSDIVSGVATTALGTAALVASAAFPPAASVAADPALLPRIVAAGLVLTGLGMVAVGVGGRTAAAPLGAAHVPESLQEEPSPGTDLPPARRLALLVFVVIAAYGAAAFGLGYVTATVAFLVALPLLLGRGTGRRRIALLGLFAVGLTAALHLGFFVLLDVPMPRTPLP